MLTLLLLITGLMQPTAHAVGIVDDLGVTRYPLELHGNSKAAVFIFVAIDCPISNGYAPEINRIIDAYSKKGIEFYLVYADPTESADQVKQHATDYHYKSPALLDGKHQLVDRFHVTVTPEAAVIDKSGQLLYRGRIDDFYVDFGKQRFAPTTHDLRDALDAVISDRPVPNPLTKAIGCEI
jgi:hypothetical protein